MQTAQSDPPLGRVRRRQVHFWLSEREYDWLRLLAATNDETISGMVRRVLRMVKSAKSHKSCLQALMAATVAMSVRYFRGVLRSRQEMVPIVYPLH